MLKPCTTWQTKIKDPQTKSPKIHDTMFDKSEKQFKINTWIDQNPNHIPWRGLLWNKK